MIEKRAFRLFRLRRALLYSTDDLGVDITHKKAPEVRS